MHPVEVIGEHRIVLVVSEADGDLLPHFPKGQPFTFAEIHQVGPELLESLRPDIILSPLLTRSFDCIDLAQILSAIGYRGAYRAMTPALPSPEVVLQEIRTLCPDIQFDLIVMDGNTLDS